MARMLTVFDVEAGIAMAKHRKEPIDIWRKRFNGSEVPLLNMKKADDRQHEFIRCFPDGSAKVRQYDSEGELVWVDRH